MQIHDIQPSRKFDASPSIRTTYQVLVQNTKYRLKYQTTSIEHLEKTAKFTWPKDPAYTGGRDMLLSGTEIFLSPDPSENRENRTMPKSRMNEIFWQVFTHKVGGIVVIKCLLRFEYQLPHPILCTTLATDKK